VTELHLLNQHQELAVDACRSLVCEWEQQAHDARLSGDQRSAQLYSQWAFAADLVASRVSVAFSKAFSSALDEWQPQLKGHTEVCLPTLTPVVTPEVLLPAA